MTPTLLDSEDVAWFRDEESLPSAARGAASALARRIGLDGPRTAEIALAVSEAATNLRRHAVDGSLLLRVLRTETDAGLEFVTVDAGPGMADVSHALTDGTSSAGTLGIGLGAISRLADTFDVHSLPGRGTVLAARFWNRAAARRAALAGEPVVAGLTRAISGEDVCGDAWAARAAGSGPTPAGAEADRPADPRSSDGRLDWAALTGAARTGTAPRPVAARRSAEPGALLMMFCDGLGHGPLAALAAQAAVAAFRVARSEDPEGVMTEIHRALRGGRGGAVAVVRIEPSARRLLFCGVGNISTFVVDPGTDGRRSLPSAPGIVGHQVPTLRTLEQTLPQDSAVIMHSDGLTERWQVGALPGLLRHTPVVVAGQLLREAAVRRDDAGVAVAKGPW